MKQLNKNQRELVCNLIKESLDNIKDDEESIYYNLGYYGEQIRHLLKLFTEGYDEYFGFDKTIDIYK